MLTRIGAVLFAALVTVAAFIVYRFIVILPLFEPLYGVAQLVCAIAFVSVAIMLHRRIRGWHTLLLVVGTLGLAGAHLHDAFIALGLRFEWFQFGGADALVFRGFFEPRENPLLAVPVKIFRYVSLLSCVGVFWLAAQLIERHLTRRCS